MNLSEPVREGLAWAVNDTAFNLSALNSNSLLFEKHVAGQLGGLLSAYALLTANITGATAAGTAQEVKMAPRWLLQKATEYGALLKPAYNDTAILPYSDFNLRSASKRGGPSLSQAGGQYLEHAYLSALTGDESYRQTVDRIRDRLKVDAWSALDGLYDVNPNTGREFRDYYRPRLLLDRWHRDEFYQRQFRLRYRKMSLGTEGRDFYYALLRSYLQSGGRLVEALQLYNEAVSSVLQNSEMITTSTGNGTGDGLVWVRDAIFVNGTTVSEYGDRMSYSTCYLGAMFALGAATFKGGEDRCHPLARRQRQLAVELTRTCHKAATGLPIRLPPDEWKMPNVLNEAIDYKSGENKHYYLTPELAESYFILWRTTKDPQYREAVWEMARALKRYAQTESGDFAGFIDLTSFTKKDNQPSLFLSATLKYLYLTFTDDSVLPLDKWIFNSAGHPLPICGQHEHLPLEKCKYSTQV